ncbi:hypothetical protein N9J19_00595 [bacterium]|jgi:hypothetical protein|nr:hypothetical protein [bacterium]|tara:strand:- start:255 stop:479 length:225 start_codon:yes stop_codon:yes gene_type:complete
MKQGLILEHVATRIPQDIPLNGKEMQLAMDKGPQLNDSWAMMCESVESRTGIAIMDGNWSVEKLVIAGEQKNFH